ncbi:cytochrome c oxidase assembly protein [Demequina oxidasica]|uniref:cytochrome c oxidase assembly protein n=1 Tax=Demequina oxidasica TaxID=676199 RepID=UPI0007803F0D|nr:cytochrome c oxidase assembly protein [Demequina oxidasica]
MSISTLVFASAGIRDISLGVTVGALLVIMALLPRGHRAVDRMGLVARVASAIWAVSAVTYLVASYAQIVPRTGTGQTASYGAGFIQEVWSFSTTIDLGKAFLQMALAAIVASIVVGFVRTPSAAAWALVPVVWALGWQAQTGHAAGAVDHHLAVSSMFLHIAGSAVWIGVITAVVLGRRQLGASTKDAVFRMSRIALWAAILVTVSGVGNAWLRFNDPMDLFASNYGRILLLKLALMAVVVALAAWHRRRTMPRLSNDHVQRRFWRVMAVDVWALVGVVTVAAVLSGTAPPADLTPIDAPTPAYFLTGYDLPPAPTFLTWFAQWRFEIISAYVLVALGVVYLIWARRLHRRGDSWPWYRSFSFIFGIVAMIWITQSGPAIYGAVTFSGHMVQHMMLVMAAPIPLALGAPVTLALRALPPRADRSRGPREWIRVIVESRIMKFFANPIVAAINFAGSLIAFYYSPVFEFALRNHAGHLWMVLHFTLVGYLFANALVGIDPGPKRPRYPLRIVLLFATMGFHAFFGVTLMASQVLLAPTWFGLMGRAWGPDAITDQQYGGQLAWGIGELPTVLLAIGVVVAWRAADAREGKRKDRQADRDDDAELKKYNAMLAQVADQDGQRGE